MEFVLTDDLFPEDLPIEERTNHWRHMFSLFSFRHERALDTILAQKRRYRYQHAVNRIQNRVLFTDCSSRFRFQNEMKNYLTMRKKRKVKIE